MHTLPHARGTRAATPAELATLAALEPTDAAWDKIYGEWPSAYPCDDAWDTRYPMLYDPEGRADRTSDNERAESRDRFEGHRDEEGGRE